MIHEKFLSIQRALRAVLRSFRASMEGPRRRTTIHHFLSSFHVGEDEDPHGHAYLHFRKRAFHRMKYAIAMARQSIDMQMFIWLADETGREIAGLLVDAANRGVTVMVHKEILGDVFELEKDFVTTKKNESDPIWSAFWHHPRITVHHANHHDHSKTFIIDDRILLVSSMNIGDAYCHNWHECLVELHGKHFVEAYRRGRIDVPHLTNAGQIAVLRSSADHPMLPVVLSLIEGATRSIRIEMAYFSDPQIVELLAKKTHQGVNVYLILPHAPDVHHHANLSAALRLMTLSRKSRVFVFRYPRGLLHTKMIIIDRKTLFIGSTNFVTSSLVTMGETNVLIHRRPRSCLRLARRRFTKDALQSVRVGTKELTRTYFQKFLSWLNL